VTRFRTVAADPAWQFRDEGIRGGTGRHYRTMPLVDIMALPVARVAAPDGHLYLWAPGAFVLDGTATRVADAWGFDPKQLLTWCKPRIGTGRWFRNTTEHVLFCVRKGSRARDHRRALNLRTHHYWPRAEHSGKPPEFYREVVERMSGGPYLELFARWPRDGWTCVGDEVGGGETEIGAWLEARAQKIDAAERAA
jgi:N6-adenosine-specific RNA methylase IME4